MKRRYITVISIMFACFSYAQEKGSGTILRVEPNGVVVHKPVDVEHTLGIKPEPVSPKEKKARPVRTLEDLSLEELEERLYHIDLKMENSEPSDDFNRYKEQKQLTEDRIRNIKQSTQSVKE